MLIVTSAERTLENLKPELLKIFSVSPEFGSIGINVTIHNNTPVRIDSTRTVTMKVTKEVK